MESVYVQRIAELRTLMQNKNWDIVLISGSDSHNNEYVAERWRQIQWLTGFDGEGELLITQDHCGLWTDSRYFISAKTMFEGSEVVLHKSRIDTELTINQWLSKFIEDKNRCYIAIDALCHTAKQIEELSLALNIDNQEDNIKIVKKDNLLDSLWLDRPIIPQNPIITLGKDIVGWSREEKITWLRSFLLKNNLDAILISALDEIAWLLNVRGKDIEYNPLVISYLLVTEDDVYWFVKKSTQWKNQEDTKDTFIELEAESIIVTDYDSVDYTISQMVEEGRIKTLLIDKKTLNYSLFKELDMILTSFDAKIQDEMSPISLRKAMKNKKEIEGMREAHIEDGLAVEKFLFDLEKRIKLIEDNIDSEESYSINEYEAAMLLETYRIDIEGYKGNSFETISAYGENAALPHYVTPKHKSKKLEPKGLYLCDSGGQYIFGTTDITRTIPLGDCSDMQKEDYTLALKGHIALSMAVFPKGTAGCHLDVLARMPLWKNKRNYGHGTGHGVGFFLNVHEGPQDIRQGVNPQPLMEGMITSNEPSMYREGQYGIRHENLLLCKSAGESEFGDWLCFEPLTLCHFDTSIVDKKLLSQSEIDWLNNYNAKVYDTFADRLSPDMREWLKSKTSAI